MIAVALLPPPRALLLLLLVLLSLTCVSALRAGACFFFFCLFFSHRDGAGVGNLGGFEGNSLLPPLLVGFSPLFGFPYVPLNR